MKKIKKFDDLNEGYIDPRFELKTRDDKILKFDAVGNYSDIKVNIGEESFVLNGFKLNDLIKYLKYYKK